MIYKEHVEFFVCFYILPCDELLGDVREGYAIALF